MSALLPDGFVLRPACTTDLSQAAALLAERGEPADATDVELVASSQGLALAPARRATAPGP